MIKLKSKLVQELIISLIIIAIGILVNFFIKDTIVTRTFQELSGYPYDEKENLFILLYSGIIGCYWFIFSNFYCHFTKRYRVIFLLIFSFLTIISSIWLISILNGIEASIIIQFQDIPFPTEPDILNKEVKIEVIKSIQKLNYSFTAIGVFALGVVGFNYKKLI